MLKWLFRILGGFVALVVVVAVGLWITRPWVPKIEIVQPGTNGVRVASDGLFGNFYPAKGEGPHPGVLVLGGSEGGLGLGPQRIALGLRDAGYSVFQLGYYGVPGTPRNLEQVPLELFDKGLDWLAKQPSIDKSRLAIVGGSKGGEAVLIVAARHPELRAVVAGMPSNVAWSGINWDNFGASFTSSWSLGGKPVPYLPFGEFDWKVGPFSGYANGLKNLSQHQDAIIPIERFKGAVLLVCGEKDSLWPSCDMSRLVVKRAKDNGGPQVELLAYPDAGHAVMGRPVDKSNPNYKSLSVLGGSADGNAAARADGWPKILAFLASNLAPAPAP